MTDPVCTPVRRPAPLSEREPAADRFVELLECLADLLVATGRQMLQIAQAQDGGDPRVREATERLARLERSLRELSAEAASIHQLLQHMRAI
jgi:flagellar biosynthesis/type III secretory pathway ATPase